MKPSIPQGTRDFGIEAVKKRQFIFQTLQEAFELFGFQAIETPAIENLETLTGKYGEEGDKLMFKILNNGLDNPSKLENTRIGFEQVLQGKSVKSITERALRYDLTIPFARYVAMNQGQLVFPFKRYQMQPVWRADRPQRGRYREFYQCDCDIIGSKSLLNEVELVHIYDRCFEKLGIPVEVRINNRKLLAALAQICGGADKLTDITIAIDKLDKIGIQKVKEELAERGLQASQIQLIEQYLLISGNNEEKLLAITRLFNGHDLASLGIEELSYILNNTRLSKNELILDFTLARGLNYYTGTIFEIKAKDIQMGSIGGGGRYDDLTGLFDVPGMPGVGISFGVDRIYDVLDELNLFPKSLANSTELLFFNLGETESQLSYQLMQQLRDHGVKSEMYHEKAKMDKQFKYAQKKNIRFVCILGSEELLENSCVIKDLETGVQTKYPVTDSKAILKLIKGL